MGDIPILSFHFSKGIQLHIIESGGGEGVCACVHVCDVWLLLCPDTLAAVFEYMSNKLFKQNMFILRT